MNALPKTVCFAWILHRWKGTEVLSFVDGVHFTEEMVPVQQEQVGVAVKPALKNAPEFLERFGRNEGGYFREVGHFWLIVFLLESVPFVEAHRLSQLQLWQYLCELLKFLVIEDPCKQIFPHSNPLFSTLENLLHASYLFILVQISEIEEDVDDGFQLLDGKGNNVF